MLPGRIIGNLSGGTRAGRTEYQHGVTGKGSTNLSPVQIVRFHTGRRDKAIAHAATLATFITSSGKLTDSDNDPAVLGTAVSHARADLGRLLREIAPELKPVVPISSFRKCFLLYLPKGWGAGIAHFLFYTSLVFIPFLLSLPILDKLSDEPSDTYSVTELFITIIVACALGFFFRYWGTVERNLSAGIVPVQRHLIGGFYWYPAVTRISVLAQLMMLIGTSNIFITLVLLPVDVHPSFQDP